MNTHFSFRWMTTLLVLLCVGISESLESQSLVKAYVSAEESMEPMPYVNVYNYMTGKGTISNESGYFEIYMSPGDSVMMSFLGYESEPVLYSESSDAQQYTLQLKSTLIDAVTIEPEEDDYLFDLIKECRKNKIVDKVNAKVYYALKSYMDTTQIELVEGYYNMQSQGYDVEWMDMKAGRLALNTHENRLFTSLDGSKSFTMMSLFDDEYKFPNHPLNVKKSKLKKSFYLYLIGKYADASTDSVYVIEYQARPRKNAALFSGKIWINKTKQTIQKIESYCEECELHPFKAIFPSDKVLNVNMHITRTFGEDEIGPYFNQIDFDYDINYLSRQGEVHSSNYTINTKAILYAYDYRNFFSVPYFEFSPMAESDFRKINAIPYNRFFWNYNDEYKLNDARDANKTFFHEESAITNLDIFKSNALIKTGLFEQPFIKWSSDRLFFKDIIDENALADQFYGSLSGYNIEAKIFMDVNSYGGKHDVQTATILDPYDSYFFEEINQRTTCFLNMYFDLCEIMRRKLHVRVAAAEGNTVLIDEIYKDFQEEFEAIKLKFITEVEMGYALDKMQEWNEYIKMYLNIDNMVLFKPIEEAENDIR